MYVESRRSGSWRVQVCRASFAARYVVEVRDNVEVAEVLR